MTRSVTNRPCTVGRKVLRVGEREDAYRLVDLLPLFLRQLRQLVLPFALDPFSFGALAFAFETLSFAVRLGG